MNRAIFITGTDTGIGKTHVTALLLGELRRRGARAAAFKPIACGAGGRNDAKIFRRLMNNEVALNDINPVYLRKPLAPSVAAKLEHKTIPLKKIHDSFRALASKYEIVLVEGAGGLMVPIKKDYFIADLATDLRCPLVVVSRLGLGAINHSVLTVLQARAAGLQVIGVVLNDLEGRPRGLAEKTNIRAVPDMCGAPLLGVVPRGLRGGGKVARQICEKLFRDTRVFE